MARFSKNGKISVKDSKFETFWVLDSDPKSTKFCLLISIHASYQRFCWIWVEMLEIHIFLGQNS